MGINDVGPAPQKTLRKGSILDTPPVKIHGGGVHDAKKDHRERRVSVQVASKKAEDSKKKQKAMSDLDELKKEVVMNEHLMTVPELCSHLETSAETGLTDEVVTHRLLRDGPNSLPPKKELPWWLVYLKELTGGFALLLWVGGIAAIVAYVVQAKVDPNCPLDNLYLGIVLIVVVFATGTFSYFQQAKSDSIMNSFRKMQPQFAAVLRNGVKAPIVASDLVVGDVVELTSGDRIPADIRIIETRGLKVDNATLTGESFPLLRTVEGTHENPLETKNLAFFSTFAVEGSAVGIVVRTGERTTMGRIARLASTVEDDVIPLTIEMNRFVIIMSSIAGTMGFLIFFVYLGKGRALIDAFVVLIGLIVANVPEGVLPATTAILTLTAKKMASMNCLVKNLSAVETLGSTSVICSDKTGTLTQNRMTVSHLWVNCRVLDSDTTEDQSKVRLDTSSPTTRSLIRCALLCNRATFRPGEGSKPVMKRDTNGDASESALLKFTEVILGDTEAGRARSPKIMEIPFNSTNKYQVSVHEAEELGGQLLLVMKGAPERILDRCSNIEIDGNMFPMNEEMRNQFQKAYETLGGMGERVLGFAEFKLPPNQFPKGFKFNVEEPNFPLCGLSFLGLISLIDPPRAAVPSAVKTCQDAGVRVIMVTGDHPITAKAIAKTVGIINPESETVEDIANKLGCAVESVDRRLAKAAVVTGSQLKEMSSEELDQIIALHPELVFARTSPQQKLIIVEGVQRTGAIVAVTGDGVNDSPALRKANIGIAMGIAGSDVSKDAAKMILLDDNFASVVVGIEQGRLIFDNLRKTIAYLITSNIPEILPYLITILSGAPQGIGTATILFIDLGTDIAPAIAMAYETAEMDIMKRPPRDLKKDRIINSQVFGMAYLQIGWMQTIIAYITYFVMFAENGFLPAEVFGRIATEGDWDNMMRNDVEDSFGQEWTFHQRRELLLAVQGAFFMTVMWTQWANLINSKCRKMSIFHKKMNNWPINGALILEALITAAIIYIPKLNIALQVRPLRGEWWTVGIICSWIIFFYDEFRRWCIRRFPGGFFQRETCY